MLLLRVFALCCGGAQPSRRGIKSSEKLRLWLAAVPGGGGRGGGGGGAAEDADQTEGRHGKHLPLPLVKPLTGCGAASAVV